MQRIVDRTGLRILLAKFATGTEDIITNSEWPAILFGVNIQDGRAWTLRNLTPDEEFIIYIGQKAIISEDSLYLYMKQFQFFFSLPSVQSKILTAVRSTGNTLASFVSRATIVLVPPLPN